MASRSLSLQSLLAVLLVWVSTAQAVHFYIDGNWPKCFYEELPKDTLVVGMYRAEAYDAQTQHFRVTPDLAIEVTVEEVFDNDHKIVSQKSTSSDRMHKFTFTAAEAGQHRICFTPSGPGAISVAGWFSNAGTSMGGTKMTLDLAIGESNKIEAEDKDKLDNLSSRILELNSRLRDIRKEQVYQREREAEFRDQSEATNSKIVRWTLIQLVVLGVTCAWQLSHLRSFFIKQKLT